MSPSLWNRYTREQDQLLLATLPTTQVCDWDCPPIDIRNLTGPQHRADLAVRLAQVRAEGARAC